jgi:hypothetical protein
MSPISVGTSTRVSLFAADVVFLSFLSYSLEPLFHCKVLLTLFVPESGGSLYDSLSMKISLSCPTSSPSSRFPVGSGQRAVGHGQEPLASRQWVVGNGQFALATLRQWAVNSGQCTVDSGQWTMDSRQFCFKANILKQITLTEFIYLLRSEYFEVNISKYIEANIRE